IRTSIFTDTNLAQIEGAKKAGGDRIELYTGPFAEIYPHYKEKAIDEYKKAANFAESIGLGVNAGHDLSLKNLGYFKTKIPQLKEVSIGHALIAEALYLGLENTIQQYKTLLK